MKWEEYRKARMNVRVAATEATIDVLPAGANLTPTREEAYVICKDVGMSDTDSVDVVVAAYGLDDTDRVVHK